MSKVAKFTSMFTSGIALAATVMALWPQTPTTTELEKFTVDYNTGYNEDIANDEVYDGASLRLPNVSRDGYSFIGWSLTQDGQLLDDSITVTADIVLYARYEQLAVTNEVFQVTLVNEVTGAFEVVDYEDGEPISLDVLVEDGYTFVGWFNGLESSSVLVNDGDLVLEDLVLFAQFDEITVPDDVYTITFYTNGGNAIDPIDVEPGEPFDLPVNPARDGLVFIEWVYNCGFDGLSMTCETFDESVQLTGDVNVYAKYDYIVPISAYQIGQLFTYNLDEDEVVGGEYVIVGFDSDLIPDEAYNDDGFITDLILPTTINGHRIIGIVNSVFSSINIVNVTLPEGYQYIGESVFAYSEIESLNLPASLGQIGYGSFEGAVITNLNFAEDSRLVSISSNAFKDTLLTDVVLPAETRSIEYQSFYNAEFTSFAFEEGSLLEYIGYQAFMNSSLSSIDLPDHLETISQNAFANTAIESIAIPASVTTLDQHLFVEMAGWPVQAPVTPSALTTVTFEGDNQWGLWNYLKDAFAGTDYYTNLVANSTDGLIVIGNSVVRFAPTLPTNISNLSYTVVIPEGVSYIEDSAFQMFDTNNNIIPYSLNLTLPSTLKVIGDGVFAGQWNNSSNRITFTTTPNFEDTELTYIGNSAFSYVTFPSATTETITFPSTLRSISFAGFRGIVANDVVFESVNHVVNIATGLFENSTLRNVVFGEGYTKLNGQSFYLATVNSITLPSSLESIGNVEFNGSISNFVVPNDLKLISAESSSFNYTNSYFSSQANDDFYHFQNVALKMKLVTDGTQNFAFNTVPGITTIATSFSWDNHINVSTLDLTGIEYIHQNSLYLVGSNSITVTLPASLQYLDAWAFYTPNSSTVNHYVLETGHHLFDNLLEKWDTFNYGGSGISNLELWFIKDHFQQNRANYTLTDSYYLLGGNILLGHQLSDTSDVVIPSGIKMIMPAVFRYNNIGSITLSSELLIITGEAFEGATIGDDIVIPASTRFIDDDAFADTYIMSDVLFENPENIRFIDAGAFLGSSIEDYDENGLFILDGVLINTSSYLSTLVIPNDVVVIAKEAFLFQEFTQGENGDTSFDMNFEQVVYIPNSVKVIVNGAFDFDEDGYLVFADDMNMNYLGAGALGDYYTGVIPYTETISSQFTPYSSLPVTYENEALQALVFVRD